MEFEVEVREAESGRLALTATGPIRMEVEDLANPPRMEVTSRLGRRAGNGLWGRTLAQATETLFAAWRSAWRSAGSRSSSSRRSRDPREGANVTLHGYRSRIKLRAATAISALAIAGCGSGSTGSASRHPATVAAALPQGHPQAVEPVAGDAPAATAQSGQSAGPAMPLSDPAPTGPASVTKAPAKGAPTDAEVRAAIARFREAVARYHLDRLDYSHVLLDPATLRPGRYYASIASVFTDYGRPVACGGLLAVPELGVANKTLPCGTEVTFVYAGRAIRVPVIDRGPYIPGRDWDLTGATAEALHFPGLGPITWRLG